MRRTILLSLASLALIAGGCGDDSNDEGGAAATGTQAATAAETAPADESTGAEAAPIEVSEDLETKPGIEAPGGEPPAELQTYDIVEGSGEEAQAGDVVSVDYVGALWKNGKEFDASWERGEPIQFQLGSGMVIPGWDEGIAGMKAGGRRLLVIPPDMAYGPQKLPGIPANSTLVFVADLKGIEG